MNSEQRWFGMCMASAVWSAFGFGLAIFAPGAWSLLAAPALGVGAMLGYWAFEEDQK